MTEMDSNTRTIATLKAALTARAEQMLLVPSSSQVRTAADEGREGERKHTRMEKASGKLLKWLQGFVKKNRAFPKKWFVRVQNHTGLYEQLQSYSSELSKAGSELSSSQAALAKRVKSLEKRLDAMAASSSTLGCDQTVLIAQLSREISDLRHRVQDFQKERPSSQTP